MGYYNLHNLYNELMDIFEHDQEHFDNFMKSEESKEPKGSSPKDIFVRILINARAWYARQEPTEQQLLRKAYSDSVTLPHELQMMLNDTKGIMDKNVRKFESEVSDE